MNRSADYIIRKRIFRHRRTAKVQISLRIHAVWSRVFTLRSQNCWVLQNVWMESKGPDDSLRMRRMIWICAACALFKCTFFAWRSPYYDGSFLNFSWKACVWPYLSVVGFIMVLLVVSLALTVGLFYCPHFFIIIVLRSYFMCFSYRSIDEVTLIALCKDFQQTPLWNIFLIFSQKTGFDALCKDFQQTALWNIFLFFPQKTGFDISCKLSPEETICIKCRILFSVRSKKKISPICRLLNLPKKVVNVKFKNPFTDRTLS